MQMLSTRCACAMLHCYYYIPKAMTQNSRDLNIEVATLLQYRLLSHLGRGWESACQQTEGHHMLNRMRFVNFKVPHHLQ